MTKPFSIIAIAVLLGMSRASAAELPTFELAGFPITAHQVALIGAVNVEEQEPTPTLMLSGMPASPHQMAVLAPRSKVTAATAGAKQASAELSAQ
ncbi:hypothetical protein L6654_30975 [Bradyrhizobium sp. WYCCWR 13023]|uniref:Uncharacterized protein n=1 Tax=Bradyrhizobium zhengyangense TaxID=2911009 RepID=A0A9X1RGE7_9BRAD|nr:hypothetical protein [Bradyrhizobium zhengyangense]MCG2631062.1 hypothetical protein [Bradyrhizobium zhengyangense]